MSAFNLPIGVTLREIDPRARCECCSEVCEKEFETPCGIFCAECIEQHLRECEECRKECE